jgi:hypothetical protein
VVNSEFQNTQFLMERAFKVRSFFTCLKDFENTIEEYIETSIDTPMLILPSLHERIKRKRVNEKLLNHLHRAYEE